jgi:hypothetical protein
VAAAPAETLRSIETAFEATGVRVGYLAPESLALFEGLGPQLDQRARGDWALVHRSHGAFVFAISSNGRPAFFRQRPASEEASDHDQEIRLSLSYYAEKLKGPGLSAVYVYDGVAGPGLADASFPVLPVPLSSKLFEADAALDERVAARPELLAAFAAVYGRA